MNTVLPCPRHDTAERQAPLEAGRRRDERRAADVPRPRNDLRPVDDVRGAHAAEARRRLAGRASVLPSLVATGDRLLHGLARMRSCLVVPLARTVGLLSAHEGWFAYGYRNLDDFARESLFRSGRWFRDLGRLQAALDEFPQLGMALRGADGRAPLSQKAALCIARVATGADAGSWIARARELPLPVLQQVVTEHEAKSRASGHETGLGATRAGETSSAARVTLRLTGPPEVKLAFDALRELHAAVVAREGGPGALVEAMLGEAASAGWLPLDELQARLRARFEARLRSPGKARSQGSKRPVSGSRAPVSRAAHMSTAHMSTSLVSPALERGQKTLAEFGLMQRHLAHLEEKLCSSPTLPCAQSRARDLRRLARILRRLMRLQDRLEGVMADLLLELHEHRAWPLLGFSGLEAYAEACLGLGRSTARRRVSLARQLRRHGSVRAAYDGGWLGEEAAQWVVRRLEKKMAGTDWIAHAALVTVKRLRGEDAMLRRQKLLGQVALAQAMTGARRVPRQAGGASALPPQPPDDAAWQASLQRVPGETRDWVFDLEHGLLERVVRGGPLTEAPLVLSLSAETASDFLACLEAVRRELGEGAAWTAAEESRLRPSARMARHRVERGEPVPTWLGLLGLLEECLWIWDEPRSMPRRPFDRVYRRDGYRCMAPGCSARAKLEVHHLQYRSQGGSDVPENLLLLCTFHHQQGEHGTLARARGQAPLNVTWRLGAPELATWWRNERRLDARLDA